STGQKSCETQPEHLNTRSANTQYPIPNTHSMQRSPLIILFVTIFIDLLGFGLILPNMAVYIQHYGGQPWVGGILLACFSITPFVFAPIWGRLSDRVGRRPLILLSLIGSAVSFFFFGWAPNL